MIPKKPYGPYSDSRRPQGALTQTLTVRLQEGQTLQNDGKVSVCPEDSNTQDVLREDHFNTKAGEVAARVLRCEECGKVVDALYEIGSGEFTMRMCKACYDAYLDDISGV